MEDWTMYHRVKKLEEKVGYWKGMALWAYGLLFVVICFIVAFGVK